MGKGGRAGALPLLDKGALSASVVYFLTFRERLGLEDGLLEVGPAFFEK